MPRHLPALLCLIGAVVMALPRQARADVTIIPSASGQLGAWLAAGPFFGSEHSLRLATSKQHPPGTRSFDLRIGANALPGHAWRILTASTGQLDLHRQLSAPSSSAFALLGAVLVADAPARLLLWLGVDDGVVVMLDGHTVYERDLWRPALHDDDAVQLSITPGRHTLLIRLRQRDGLWTFRARLLDTDKLLPPSNVRFMLPGVEPSQA
ncbi:MAG: hypothetical protein MUF54_04980, partial [Polyangiaceae bacterium]|nr:hypothetical protein [Polyangiaceae bacterium]